MGDEPILDKRRVLKNSVKLYGRTLFTLVVGLYNSRVVLEVLGVDDFGVYSLVGSLAVVFYFFTSTVASAMSRFFAFELASGDKVRLRLTFGNAMLVVGLIALLIIALAESWGSWFINRLDIPDTTRGLAYIVYQLTVLTAVLSIIQTCYMSAIIARERMGVFAFIDIANSTMKLAAIFALKYVMAEKLILYSVLVALISLIITTFTISYCRKHFDECRTWFVFKRPLFKSLLTFSGWNLYKTLCDTLRPTGINVVVNLFFGVVINAAVAIALNVSANVVKFTANVFLAFKPQIVKAYAMEAYAELSQLLHNALKFSLLALSLVIITLIVEMPYVLKLWLNECPEYAALFCRLLCISLFFEITVSIIEYGINATGNIRSFSLINGTLTLSIVGIGAIAYKLGAPPPAIYVAQICVEIVCVIADMILLQHLIPQISLAPVYKPFMSILLLNVFVCGICFAVHIFIADESFLRFVLVGMVDVILIGTIAYIFYIPAGMKQKLLAKLHIGKQL